MDKILFRGKRIDNGEWAYGTALLWNGKAKIIKHRLCINNNWITVDFMVISESVGQFTGLLNKDGSKLFSGKIRIDINGVGGGDAEIEMYQGQWQIQETAQGYFPLYRALKRDDFTITQEQ